MAFDLAHLQTTALARDPSNLPYLKQVAIQQDGATRILALQGLSWLRRLDEASFITGFLSDPDVNVRVCAAKALALTGIDEVHVRALTRTLKQDAAPGVRSACIGTLSWLQKLDVALIEPCFTSAEPKDVVAAALQAVERMGFVSCLPHVLNHLTSRHSCHRHLAARALANLSPNDAWSHLAPHLYDANPDVRVVVLRFLSTSGLSEAAQFIVDGLNDSNPGVRATAAIALGTLGDPRFLEAIEAHAHDEHPEVRLRLSEAAEILQKVD